MSSWPGRRKGWEGSRQKLARKEEKGGARQTKGEDGSGLGGAVTSATLQALRTPIQHSTWCKDRCGDSFPHGDRPTPAIVRGEGNKVVNLGAAVRHRVYCPPLCP